MPLGESESRSLAAGGATVVSFTVPGEAFADLDGSPVVGLGAELLVGDTVVAAGTSAYANADVPASGSVAVALAAPLTAPTTSGAVGLIGADQLENWTGPTGLLTRQLDALAGRRVAIGIDPRIIASIRVLGTSAPASALAWLQRLADVPNEVFPLAYADADLAVQAQLELPALLTPTSFSDVLDPANFAAGADGGADAGDGATAPATDEPIEPEPTPGEVPTTEELLEWPYTRTDLAWPADDTVAAGNLAYFDAAGLTTALLAPGNVEPVDGPASASATIDGSTALVADGGITGPLRSASEASTDTEWREATGELLAELALDAGASRTTVLATFDRGATSQTARVSALIDEIGGSGWSSLAGLSEAIGGPARVADAARRARDRRAPHRGRAHGRDGGRRHRVRDGARRRAAAHRAHAPRAPVAARRRLARRSRGVDLNGLRLARSGSAPYSPASRSFRAARSTWSRPRPACPRRSRTTCPTP